MMISLAELSNRQKKFQETLHSLRLTGAILFRPEHIKYFTNFIFLPTERPVALIVPAESAPLILLPKLEEEHFIAQVPWMTQIHVYREYPGKTHPMTYLNKILDKNKLSDGTIGCDNDGYLPQNGYRGPTLSSSSQVSVKDISQIIDQMRLVKSDEEIAILRQCGLWGSIVHENLQHSMVAGKSEHEISRLAEEKTYLKIEDEALSNKSLSRMSVHASFRSGTRTSMPHAAMGGRKLSQGDILVTYCQGKLSGYMTELERTMFLGEPDDEKKSYFGIVRKAQLIALGLIEPGTRCSQVDEAVNEFFIKQNVFQYSQHHQGHGLGIEFHERPFLDTGDDTVIQSGMVFSVEPGLYIEGLGGFRHSDTVLVTDSGAEILTPYPSEIRDLIIDQ